MFALVKESQTGLVIIKIHWNEYFLMKDCQYLGVGYNVYQLDNNFIPVLKVTNF